MVETSWKVMAHAQKPDLVFRRNGRVYLNRWGRQFSRLLAAEVCASAVVMLDTPCSEVVWRVLATHSIRQFPLHFPSRASPCAITFQLESTHATYDIMNAVNHNAPLPCINSRLETQYLTEICLKAFWTLQMHPVISLGRHFKVFNIFSVNLWSFTVCGCILHFHSSIPSSQCLIYVKNRN